MTAIMLIVLLITSDLFTDGKGRTTTLAAITSFASLMVISTLGKDPSTDHVFDDVYGDIIQEVLEEDTESEKANSDDTADKVQFDLGRLIFTATNPSPLF